MVAVRVEPLKQLLAGLDQRDASPVALVPMAFLALDRHLADRAVPPEHALLWRHDGQTELFVVRDGRPLAWRHATTPSSDELAQFCSIDSLEQSVETPWIARGLEPSQVDRLKEQGIEAVAAEESPWEEAVRLSCDAITAGEREPLIDLRRDELAGQRPVQAVAPQLRRLKVAAVLAGLAICGALWLRGDQYAESSVDVQQRLTATFESTFPKEPPPERILPAIRKAHALLQGTRGPVKELPTGPSCDQVLQQVLAALPSDLRYRVPEIRLEGSSIYLGGEVRSNSDAIGSPQHCGQQDLKSTPRGRSGWPKRDSRCVWPGRWRPQRRRPPSNEARQRPFPALDEPADLRLASDDRLAVV